MNMITSAIVYQGASPTLTFRIPPITSVIRKKSPARSTRWNEASTSDAIRLPPSITENSAEAWNGPAPRWSTAIFGSSAWKAPAITSAIARSTNISERMPG